MRKYEYNKNIFKEIKTEDEAYWLGFLIADGHNHENKILRIDIKDNGHLEKLSKLIYPKGNKPIFNIDHGFGKIYCFSCAITEIVENLALHGVVHKKSLIAKLPDLDSDMYRHFIRGIFDGDGSLCYSMDKNYRRYSFSIVGTKELMLGIREKILDESGIVLSHGKMKMIYRTYKRGNQQILILLEWLYKDSTIFLERKYLKYQDMLNYYKSKQNGIK